MRISLIPWGKYESFFTSKKLLKFSIWVVENYEIFKHQLMPIFFKKLYMLRKLDHKFVCWSLIFETDRTVATLCCVTLTQWWIAKEFGGSFLCLCFFPQHCWTKDCSLESQAISWNHKGKCLSMANWQTVGVWFRTGSFEAAFLETR